MESSFSKPERELLKTIYRLSSPGNAAHTSDVAERLGVTAGTVTVGVKRLADRDLVVHRPYKGMELTDQGDKVAIGVMRRHRIAERFLSDMLGYSWKDADRLATSFEHQIPQEVEDRLFEVLGEPQSCPHGLPIPELGSKEAPETLRRLIDMPLGKEVRVVLKGDLQSEMAEFLDGLGVRPGALVELRDRQPFDGPLVVCVDGVEHAVGETVARNIHVQSAEGDADEDMPFERSS